MLASEVKVVITKAIIVHYTSQEQNFIVSMFCFIKQHL